MQFVMADVEFQTVDKGCKRYPDVSVEDAWNDFGEMHNYYFKGLTYENPIQSSKNLRRLGDPMKIDRKMDISIKNHPAGIYC